MNNLQPFNQDSKYLKGALALVEHPNIGEAARASKICRTILWRWLRTEDFLIILRAVQAQAANAALARLSGAMDRAAEVLISEMTNQESTPACRITAARAVIRLALEARGKPDDEREALRAVEQIVRRDGDK